MEAFPPPDSKDPPDPTLSPELDSFIILSKLGCPAPTDLLASYPDLAPDEWKRRVENLAEGGLEPDRIGMLLALYPWLVNSDAIRSLEANAVAWLNSVAAAVDTVRALSPSLYYQAYVVDDKSKGQNLCIVGQKIYDALGTETADIASTDIVQRPDIFAAHHVKLKLEQRLRHLNLDPDLLHGSAREEFNERVEKLDPKSPEFVACVVYTFNQAKDRTRNQLLKVMGVAPEEADEVFIELVEAAGREPSSFSLTRLVTLWNLLERQSTTLKRVLSEYPELLATPTVSFERLASIADLSDRQVTELRKSINIKGKAIKKNMQRHTSLAASGTQTTIVMSPEVQRLRAGLAEAGVRLDPEYIVRLHKVYPEVMAAAALRRAGFRTYALQEVMGSQLATLVIEDNLSYLGETQPRVVINKELPLTPEQRKELREVLHLKRQLFYDRARQKEEAAATDIDLENDPKAQEAAALIGAVLLTHEVNADVVQMAATDPRILEHTDVFRMDVRVQALVEVCGNTKAAKLLVRHPRYLTTHRPVQALQESIDPKVKATLRRKILRVSENERRRQATA